MGEPRMTAKRKYPALACKAPYDNSVLAYLDAGWSCPLPAGGKTMKEPLVTGYSGWKNDWKKVTKKAVTALQKKYSGNGYNIAQWLPPGIIGIDVDEYGTKKGWQTLKGLEAELCPLPDTIISSARAGGKSGIRYFKVPLDLDLHGVGIIGKDIEAVHRGTRIAVVPPSYHPDVNDYYRWYLPGEEIDGEGSLEPVDIDLADDLPPIWIDWIQNRKFSKHVPEKDFGSKTKNRAAVDAWMDGHAGDPCAAMLRAVEPAMEALEGKIQRHDNAYIATYRIACLAAEGHSGFRQVMESLWLAFGESRVGDYKSPGEVMEEWLRFLDGGVKRVMTREDAGEFIGYPNPCHCGALTDAGRPRPQFSVLNYDLIPTMVECYRALAAQAASSWNGAYNRGGQIVLRTQHGIVEASADSLRSALARVTEWLAPGGDGPPQRKNPPRELLASLLADPELHTLPPLRGTTRSPFWALVDGKPQLVHENGYHAGSQVLLNMDPELADAVRHVGHEDTSFGMAKIEYMLSEFPFESDSDRANVYAALLLPYVRELISGPTPLHLIHAPGPGSGKTMLANTISKVIGALDMLGRFSVTLPSGRNADEEIKKTILSALRTSPQVFIWDNVVGEVKSKELAQALTEVTYGGRVLGESRTAEYANTCLWMATGNQFRAIEDIRRRIIPIKLKAYTKRPAPFDMDEFLGADRKYIVWALLSMVQKWVDTGAVPARSRTLASYERYAEVIGGILDANGVRGFLGNMAGFQEASMVDVDEYPELVEEWASKHSTLELGEWYRVGDILTGLTSVGEWVDSGKPGASRALGVILNGLKDRPIGENGAYLIQAKRPGNVVHYSLTLRKNAVPVRRGGRRVKLA